jgi:uncharacterized oligopeptide transporter (OPT) family protein
MRWLIPWTALAAYLAFVVLSFEHPIARIPLALGTIALLLGVIGLSIAEPGRKLPRWLSLPTFALVGSAAVIHASVRAMKGERSPIWEPTRRTLEPAADRTTAPTP